MAITNGRIVAGSATERRRTGGPRVQTHPVEPGTEYYREGFGIVLIESPSREGELYFHYFIDGLNRQVIIYVGVEINGDLAWKYGGRVTQVNKYTGKPHDPIYDR